MYPYLVVVVCERTLVAEHRVVSPNYAAGRIRDKIKSTNVTRMACGSWIRICIVSCSLRFLLQATGLPHTYFAAYMESLLAFFIASRWCTSFVVMYVCLFR